MKRLKKAILALLFMLLLSSFAVAGWLHVPGSRRTTWTDTPTPATCWTRDNRLNIVWAAQKLLIYQDTPRYFNYAADAATVDKAYTGFWEQDANGIYWPRTDLDGAWAGDVRVNLIWMDVEWDIDADNILWVK